MTTALHTDTVVLHGVPIFRAGDYPQGRYDTDTLEHIAASYDPAVHEAPNYLSHPDGHGTRDGRGLAFGWISRLWVHGDQLFADMADVPRAFAELLLAGRIKKRSVELYGDLDGRGPYLRAVAWPAIPQVKALADVTAADIYHESVSSSPQATAIDVTFPPCNAKETHMSEPTATETPPTIVPPHTDDDTFVTCRQFDERLDTLRRELLDAQHTIAERIEVQMFCDQMTAAGRMTPAERATEQPLLIEQKRRERINDDNDRPASATSLSQQRMDYFRSRTPVVSVTPDSTSRLPANAPAVDPDRRRIEQYYNEHRQWFERFGCTVDDLVAADNFEHSA